MVESIDTSTSAGNASANKGKLFKEHMDESFEKIKAKLSSKKYKELL